MTTTTANAITNVRTDDILSATLITLYHQDDSGVEHLLMNTMVLKRLRIVLFMRLVTNTSMQVRNNYDNE